MRKITTIIAAIATAVITVAVSLSPASAALNAPVANMHGAWTVSTLASEADGSSIEAYKLDKSLIAWTEVNAARKERKLFVFDGQTIRTLATMPVSEWSEPDAYFYDAVTGSFDVADGMVVWIQSDGNDREVFAFDGDKTFRVSDNGYNDKHPVVSRGRVAWTSTPGGASYNLMVREPNGRIFRAALWHVPDYAFSANVLYWIEKVPNRTAFQVKSNDGLSTKTVGGNADDRVVKTYFTADGKGSVAWTYAQSWTADMHEYWHSLNGAKAVQMSRRTVNQYSPRLEDVNGPEILLNSKDIVYSWNKRHLGNSLLKVNYTLQEQTEFQKREHSKARYMDGGYVAHSTSDVDSPLVMHDGGEHYLSLEIVLHDIFDADGATAAGGILGKGVLLYTRGETATVPTIRQIRSIAVKNGDVAWIEGEAGKGLLTFAAPTVLVKTQTSAKNVSGRLVKAAGNPTVYLAGIDGMRYGIPGEGQFYSWFSSFNSVQVVSQKTLDAMPVEGTVLYRAGSRLLKTASFPTVYAIGDNGNVFPISGVDAAKEIAGANWKERIDVMNSARMSDYTVGRTVTSLTDYNFAKAGIRF